MTVIRGADGRDFVLPLEVGTARALHSDDAKEICRTSVSHLLNRTF